MQQSHERLFYSTLNTKEHEIRLVHLQPRISSETIECSIVTANLDRILSYEALSYEWGDPDCEQRQIIVNATTIQIRENLWWALYHLREDTQPRTLWIDALCINQDDVHERNHQVGQMDKIYSQAARVVAWVGREHALERNMFSNEAKTAISFIQELNTHSIVGYPYRDNNSSPHGFGRTPHTIKWDALGLFCRRRYWSRLWIIQEIVLASSILVQCGALSISWESFSGVCSQLRLNRPNIRFPTPQQNITKSVPFYLWSIRMVEDSKKSSLVDLLLQFKNSECRDIRDRVFGILSLSQKCCREDLPADYSVGVTSICIRLLDHHLSHHSKSKDSNPIMVCQNVLHALGMEFRPNSKPDPSSVNRSLRELKSDGKYSVRNTYGGRIVWLSSEDEVLRLLWIRRDFQLPFLAASSVRDAYRTDSFHLLPGEMSYFDSKSDYLTNRNSTHGLLSTSAKHKITAPSWIHKGEAFFKGLIPRRRDRGKRRCMFEKISAKDKTREREFDGARRFLREQAAMKNTHYGKWRQFFHDYLSECRVHGFQFFLTTTGMVGCVTQKVRIDDTVCKIDGGLGRLVIISKPDSSCKVTGKGLEIQPRSAQGSSKRRFERRIDLKVDVVTLLYLTGYF